MNNYLNSLKYFDSLTQFIIFFMDLTCKDILVIHLQILNEDLVNDYYRGLFQNIVIKLDIIDNVEKIIICRGLSLIHSDPKQYFLNVNKVNRSINSFRANNFSFDINLMHASIYAGGFSNVYFLKRMQIYLHNQFHNLFKVFGQQKSARNIKII